MTHSFLHRIAHTILVLAAPVTSACDQLLVSQAWIREPPPVAAVAAGYFVIENRHAHEVTIDRVDSDCCSNVAMHRSIVTANSVSMSPLSSLRLAPGESAVFEPGGNHLMLENPTTPIEQGQVIRVEFFCAEGDSTEVDFAIARLR